MVHFSKLALVSLVGCALGHLTETPNLFEAISPRTTPAVTWDQYSWMINGKRILVHSGEVSMNL